MNLMALEALPEELFEQILCLLFVVGWIIWALMIARD